MNHSTSLFVAILVSLTLWAAVAFIAIAVTRAIGASVLCTATK